MSELKPCPFCGSGDAGAAWHHGYWSVRCSYWAKDNYPNRCNQDWGEFETEEQAIAAWNRRPSTAREVSLEELKQMHGQPVWLKFKTGEVYCRVIESISDAIWPYVHFMGGESLCLCAGHLGKTYWAYTAPPKED